ncbi:polyketide synthase [Moniliophthora roreri]|nr:polyketide synthase [Moniliophthora roreri]
MQLSFLSPPPSQTLSLLSSRITCTVIDGLWVLLACVKFSVRTYVDPVFTNILSIHIPGQ